MKGNFVWMLWGVFQNERFLEGVYVNKDRAEADLRQLNKDDPDAEYWVQQREVTR
jgi:hypothetical protein